MVYIILHTADDYFINVFLIYQSSLPLNTFTMFSAGIGAEVLALL